ncbi:MAG: hypothetical protein WC962_08850, partial [Phycisphaerae bacterium]
DLILVDTGLSAVQDEIDECLKLAKQADVVVMTNYYARIVKTGNNQLLAKKLKAAGHKVVVMTNFPYVEGTTAEADAAVCNFSGTPDSIRVSAGVIFGKIKTSASTKMPVKLQGQKTTPMKKLKAAKANPFGLSGS